MTRYPYLLFDADNTLFDFDEANVSSFRSVCAYAGLAFTPELFACFDRHNNAAWARFDRGELTKDETLRIQFREMSEELGLELDIEGWARRSRSAHGGWTISRGSTPSATAVSARTVSPDGSGASASSSTPYRTWYSQRSCCAICRASACCSSWPRSPASTVRRRRRAG